MNSVNIEKFFEGKGGYVFISHSHKDIRVVREIRNLFEENGFEPILFYLKCMDQGFDDNVELLKEIIHKEIDARELFLYVDSDNARASKWVQEEITHAKKDIKKRIEIISIEEIVNSDNKYDKLIVDIKSKIGNIIKSSNAYVIYNNTDEEVFVKIQEFLIKKDYRVFNPKEDLLAGDFAEQIKGKITEAANNGIILYIVSKKSIESKWCRTELELAKEKNAKIIFLALDDIDNSILEKEGFVGAPIIKYDDSESFYNELSKKILLMKY